MGIYQYVSTALGMSCFSAMPAPTTTSDTPSATVRRMWDSVQWCNQGGKHFQIVTVASCMAHLAVGSLVCAELLKLDGMEEEAHVFGLYYTHFLFE